MSENLRFSPSLCRPFCIQYWGWDKITFILRGVLTKPSPSHIIFREVKTLKKKLTDQSKCTIYCGDGREWGNNVRSDCGEIKPIPVNRLTYSTGWPLQCMNCAWHSLSSWPIFCFNFLSALLLVWMTKKRSQFPWLQVLAQCTDFTDIVALIGAHSLWRLRFVCTVVINCFLIFTVCVLLQYTLLSN